MSNAGKYILVYATGAAGIWKGAPLGIALNLPSFLTGLLIALGSITTVLFLFFAGESIRQWILRRYSKQKVEKNKTRFLKLANRFGIGVFGILAPGLLGPIPAILLGLILIKDRWKFLLFLIVGITIWSFILAYLFDPIFDLISNFRN